MFASAYLHDAAFGAMHDAYAYVWSESGFFNPPNSPLEAAKAMRWALQSTTAPTPVINVGVLSEASDTKHLDRQRPCPFALPGADQQHSQPRDHLLAQYPAQCAPQQ